MNLARVTGVLPSDLLGTDDAPAEEVVYLQGCAKLGVRHIQPPAGLVMRGVRLGNPVVLAECGHMAWCPIVGPWPSLDWRVCVECLRAWRARSDTKLPGGDPPIPPAGHVRPG
ncbi:hypothetical protein [Saccharopolyspora elongata]|uniref:Uncharacterized protein n=1 Tax=Saccharopolyspora elongata TaxID=2530387 RepID=A0A4R4YA22_9PSEU|nr:hypothetical protein [Saccharopolyspora elongata]TDD41355.1 hypothetical protein E1288_32780 [Saccharopolyspora elongata]